MVKWQSAKQWEKKLFNINVLKITKSMAANSTISHPTNKNVFKKKK